MGKKKTKKEPTESELRVKAAAEQIKAHLDEIVAKVNAKLRDGFPDFIKKITAEIYESLVQSDGRLDYHTEIVDDGCEWDRSGEYHQTKERINPDRTLWDVLDNEYTGGWEATHCSGCGKHWITLMDGLNDECRDFAEGFIGEVLEEYGVGFTRNEFSDLWDEVHDSIYYESDVNVFYSAEILFERPLGFSKEITLREVLLMGRKESGCTVESEPWETESYPSQGDYISESHATESAAESDSQEDEDEDDVEDEDEYEDDDEEDDDDDISAPTKSSKPSKSIEYILTAIPDHYPDIYPLARLLHRKFILHVGPTNSGKTHAAVEAMEKAESGIYLAPLRLLAYEQYERINSDGYVCNLVTGEEEQYHEGATFQSSTVEMLPLEAHFAVAVIDECQMCADKERGGAWTAAILGVQADVVHLCMAPEAESICKKIIEDCGDSYEVVYHDRKTPLVEDQNKFRFPNHVQQGDALIVFSRRNVHAVAAVLQAMGKKCSIIYGALPYDVRHKQAEDFANGKTDVVVATDAIGMGMNLPIKRVVFLEQTKYDGTSTRKLRAAEVQQIAGRAGRYGLHEQGLYTAAGDRQIMRSGMHQTPPTISAAIVSFPPTLIYLGEKLSMAMKHWKSIPNSEIYNKANIENQIKLVQAAERKTTDRQIIFTFSCFPVNVQNDALMMMWHTMLNSVILGIPYTCPAWLNREVPEKADLGDLEQWYKACDLLYYYKTRYERDNFQWVSAKKNEISKKIIEILDQQKLQPRKCGSCGKTLEWNYPYGICQKCYNKRYSYWGDDYY